jgi:hypothetical protein
MAGVVVVVVLAAVLIAFLAYRSYQNEQKRKDLLFSWATNNHYAVVPEDDSLCTRWSGNPFGEGDHRRARDVVTGTTSHPFVAFDYSYETHSSDGKGNTTTETHRFCVTALELRAWLPTLQVTPENLLTRFGNAVGFDDIELESEDFNRKFRVHASDRKFACDVLSPRTMQALLASPAGSWRIEGKDIITWSPGRLTPSTIIAALATLQLVVDGIPSFVWKDNS